MFHKFVLFIFIFCFVNFSFSQVTTSGMKLWLKADDGVLQSGGVVSQWNDASGNGFNLTQSTTSARPQFVSNTPNFNNKPVVRFDGVDDFMSVDFLQSFSAPNSFFIVYNNTRTGTTAGGIFDGLVDGSRNTFMYITQSSVGRLLTQTATGSFIRYNKTQPYDFILNSVFFNGASSYIGENGNQMVLANLPNQPISGFQIGRRTGGGTSFLQGNIAEVIFYNRVLTVAEQQQVEKYLMDKYAPPVNLGADINNAYGFCDLTLAPTGGF
ncbi:MAG: hypothetical protein RL264_2290, partial [Bacteroidota bacterium]